MRALWLDCALLLIAVASISATQAASPRAKAAQDQSSPPELTIESSAFRPQPLLLSNAEVVALSVLVRDGQGRAIPNLTRGDFEIFDRGVEQTIASFSMERREPAPAPGPAASGSNGVPPPTAGPALEPARPRAVALFFDDLDSSFADLVRARLAATTFLQAGIPAGESVGIFTSSGRHAVPFGGNVAALLADVRELKPVVRLTPPCQGVTQMLAYQASVKNDRGAATVIGAACCPGCPYPESIGKASADSYWSEVENQSSAILGALNDAVLALGREPGQRVLVVSGSGFIADTLLRQQVGLEENALRYNIVINTLNAGGLSTSAGNRAMDAVGVDTWWAAEETHRNEKPGLLSVDTVLGDLAADTGGTYFHNRNDLGPGMQALANGPAVEYLMSFAPANLVADGSFHPIKVRMRSVGSGSIQTRPGYYAPAREENPSAAELRGRLNEAAMADDEEAQIPATLAISAAPRSDRTPATFRLKLTVDARKLDWTSIAGRHFEQLTFAAVLSRPNGAFATGEQSTMTLRLHDATRERMEKTGITGDMRIPVLAGSYRLRVVVMESVHGKLASFSRDVIVP